MVIIHILDRKRIKRSESTEKRGRNRENNELKIVDDKTVHLINVRSRYTFICILSPAGFAIRFCKAEKKTERIAENMKSNVCVCVLESNIRESNRKKNSYRGFHRVYTMQRRAIESIGNALSDPKGYRVRIGNIPDNFDSLDSLEWKLIKIKWWFMEHMIRLVVVRCIEWFSFFIVSTLDSPETQNSEYLLFRKSVWFCKDKAESKQMIKLFAFFLSTYSS